MNPKPAVMIQRVLFGALAIVLLVALFQLDRGIASHATGMPDRIGELLKHGSVIPMLFLVVLLLGAREMDRLLRARGIQPFSMFAYLMIAVMLLLPWLSPAGLLGSRVADREGLYWPLVGILGSILGVGVLCVLRNNPTGTIRDGGATLLMIVYLGFLGSFGLQTRCGIDSRQQQGVWLLLVVILVTKSSDIGAYFVGSAVGRHKLIPRVSPGKSIEGALGGLLGSATAAMLFASADRWPAWLGWAPGRFAWMLDEIALSFGVAFNGDGVTPIRGAFLFGLLLSISAQTGDLFESCFKRDAGIKDSGAVMPHYGGILDLVDSPIFAMPIAWFLFTRIWNVG
jgi:phosphatidate cytidylyltransferase